VYRPIRETMLRLCIELASTTQRDKFVDRPNEFIQTNCSTLAQLCDRIVQHLYDTLALQPASLDVALITKTVNEELGMHIHSSYSG
jgi:dTDP-D-glucose 4,6-dehydratase